MVERGSIRELVLDLVSTTVVLGVALVLAGWVVTGSVPLWLVVVCATPLALVLAVLVFVGLVCLPSLIKERRR